jgi:hypothetical protein
MTERNEFSSDPLNRSLWVAFDPFSESLHAANDQWTLDVPTGRGEQRSEDFGGSAAASRRTSGILTGAIAALLSLMTGFLFTFIVNDITGRPHQWVFWPVAGLYFAVWIAEQRRFPGQRSKCTAVSLGFDGCCRTRRNMP